MGRQQQRLMLEETQQRKQKTGFGLMFVFRRGESCREQKEHLSGFGSIVESFCSVLFLRCIVSSARRSSFYLSVSRKSDRVWKV